MSEAKPIYAALLAIQRDLKANKGQYNPFGKYYYRSAEDIVESVKPLLAELGLILKMSDEIVLVGDRYYVKATATVIDIVTGDSESTVAYAREPQDKKGTDASQITGAASSYSRKYALNGLFAIDDCKDADTAEYNAENAQDGAGRVQNQKPTTNTSSPQKAAQSDNLRAKALKGLNEIIKTCGCTSTELVAIAQKHYGKSSTKDMTVGEISNLAANLEQYIKENAA